MRRILSLMVVIIFITVAFIIIGIHQTRPPVPQTIKVSDTISVADYSFDIAIAQTPEQQSKGLGGVTRLEPNQGMYFPLNGRFASFWMKNMLIPIDIIWIKNQHIAGINANAQPQPDTTDSQLKQYPSPVAQPDAVLEIAAGQSQKLGINIGDKVKR